MKVLVVGKQNMLFWPQHVCDALDELGYQSEIFLFNDLGYVKRSAVSLVKKISKKMSEELLASFFRKKLYDFRPDVVIFVSAFFIPQRLYDVLAALPEKPYTIGWSGDAFDVSVGDKARILDKLYSTDSFFVDRGLSYGWETAYLPLGFNPRLFVPPGQAVRRTNGAVFIGNPAPDRQELLSGLNYPVTLIGSGWGKIHTGIHPKTARSVALSDVVRLYQSTTAVVNMRQGANVVNGLNMRSFEAPACGALLLHDAVEDVHRHYLEGEELLVYRDGSGLDELLRQVATGCGELETIALRGRERAWDEHMYRHRIARMMSDTGAG